MYNRNIQFVPFLLLCVVAVHQINGKHAQVLVKELDVAIVDSFCNLFADLVRASSFDHVQTCPSVLCLRPRRCPHKKVVF